MASQEKNQNQPQGPASSDKTTQAAAEPQAFSPSGLYIKDRTGKEMPLMHTVQEIVDIYNSGATMSIYGIFYGSIQALPDHVRAAINEVSGPGAAGQTVDGIKARIAALQSELKERSAVLPA